MAIIKSADFVYEGTLTETQRARMLDKQFEAICQMLGYLEQQSGYEKAIENMEELKKQAAQAKIKQAEDARLARQQALLEKEVEAQQKAIEAMEAKKKELEEAKAALGAPAVAPAKAPVTDPNDVNGDGKVNKDEMLKALATKVTPEELKKIEALHWKKIEIEYKKYF